MSEVEVAVEEPTSLHRVAVKSRTGGSYFRGPRAWPADSWLRAEVTRDELTVLRDDPWLDVRVLDETEAVDDPEVGDRLGAALARVAYLERALAAREHAHAAELDAMREAHARELAGFTSRRRGSAEK